MNISSDARLKDRLNINILCAVNQHEYCTPEDTQSCGCECHFRTVVLGEDFMDFAYYLWRASDLEALRGSDRNTRILHIIMCAGDKVDFGGFSAEEIFEQLKPTMARPHWSRKETEEDILAFGA